MDALRAARHQLGESDPLPPGVACSFAPDGTVTLLDPVARRRLVLEQAPAGAADADSPATEVEPAATARTGEPAAAGAEEPPEKRLSKTVAFEPGEITVPTKEVAVGKAAASAQVREAETPAEAKKVAIAKVELQQEAAGQVAARKKKPSARVRKPSARTVARTVSLELLLERNEEPTQKNPLVYRERAYLVPKGSDPEVVAGKLREVLVGVQNDLEKVPKGKLVNLAAFDHRWEGRPFHPPLVILQWKDWHGEPQVAFPNAAVSIPPGGVSAEGDQDKLADAFEALHDLFFLNSPVEGLEFVTDLLQQVVPAEAYSTCLYDINTNELRFVVMTGPHAEERKGEAIPVTAGLMGHAARAEEKTIVINEVASDSRYDAAIDGREGLEARNMLLRSLVSEGQLIGMLQLINRDGQPHFSRDDVNLVNYVAKQLSKFLHGSRLGLERTENDKKS
jgi:hypothetical protein